MRARLMNLSLALALASGVCVSITAASEPAPVAPAKDVAAAAPVAEPRFVRVHESADGKIISMQLCAREFAKADGTGPTVTLVSAMHIGDASFYQSLQDVLDPMDAVLFEGVRPSGTGRSEFDAEADSDARKAKRTERRIRLIAIAANVARLKDGTYPPTLDALLDSAEPRLKAALAGADLDAWGRKLEYTVTPIAPEPANDAKDETKDEPRAGKPAERLEIISLGSDAKPDGDGHGKDLKLSDQPKLKSSEIPRSAGGSSKGIQQELASSLGLEFQLDAMTHERANWRSSDLAIDQVQERIAAAGGDSATLFKTLEGASMQASLIRLVLGLMKLIPGGQAMGKLIMIETLSRADDLMKSGGAPGMDEKTMSVIVHDRNAVVMSDLKKIIDTEPAIKTVGIIYGAAHMPDLEAQLAGLGFKETKATWHDAMSVDTTKAGMPEKQVQSLRKQIRQAIDAQMKNMAKANARKQKQENAETP